MNPVRQINHFTKEIVLDKYNDLLNIKDLSIIFGVSKQTIYKEIKDGKFGEPIKIGRAYKIPKIYIINNFFLNYATKEREEVRTSGVFLVSSTD